MLQAMQYHFATISYTQECHFYCAVLFNKTASPKEKKMKWLIALFLDVSPEKFCEMYPKQHISGFAEI